MERMNIIDKAKQYAHDCTRLTNHRYDGHAYTFHLNMVYEAALRFIHLIPEKDQSNVLAACWVHDVIEDCRQTYNDVLKATSVEVAELAYALTNEKGKNRNERANDKYYHDMKLVPHAVFLKACDRIANCRHSMDTGSRMAAMYEREMPEFVKKIYDEKYDEIFVYLLQFSPGVSSTPIQRK